MRNGGLFHKLSIKTKRGVKKFTEKYKKKNIFWQVI